jgi:hypothetical protein
MDKIWYILIDSVEEGPFSAKDLLHDKRVTLQTLVWREGLDNWVPLREISELRKLFEKRDYPTEEKEEEKGAESLPPQDELVLEYGKDPNFLFFWLVIALILAIYIIYELYSFT